MEKYTLKNPEKFGMKFATVTWDNTNKQWYANFKCISRFGDYYKSDFFTKHVTAKRLIAGWYDKEKQGKLKPVWEYSNA